MGVFPKPIPNNWLGSNFPYVSGYARDRSLIVFKRNTIQFLHGEGAPIEADLSIAGYESSTCGVDLEVQPDLAVALMIADRRADLKVVRRAILDDELVSALWPHARPSSFFWRHHPRAQRGSLLDADVASKGVPFARRLTASSFA